VLLCLQAREIEAGLGPAARRMKPGPVHDVRVAGRRLRAGITVFQRLYPGLWHSTVTLARDITRGFCQVRDLDIRRARLARLARRLGPGDAPCRRVFSGLLEEVARERRRLAAAVGPGAGAVGPVIEGLWEPRRSRATDAERFSRVWLHSLSHIVLDSIPMASVEAHGGAQHRLRIRAKALRYSLEMLEWRLGEETGWRTAVLRRVQDVLGEIHDIDVLLDCIGGRSGGAAAPAGSCLERARRALQEERRGSFKEFLRLRPRLERACGPIHHR